jgi:farnesyl diphosphate synthase
MNPSNFKVWMQDHANRIESWLDARIPLNPSVPGRLHDAMRYSALGGGKRMRPLLAYAAGAVTEAKTEDLDIVAGAVELIHAYSLVHDDMPCMDDDVLRRGRATCHVEFGEATALLVGDSLQTLAFELLAKTPMAISPSKQLGMVLLLAEASGADGMAGGQAIDLASVNLTLDIAMLENMHLRKTGALIRAAILLGARCGCDDAPETQAALDRFARAAGLAFQVIDDVLDTEADTATLGKTAGKDEAANKPTYVSLLGLDAARSLSQSLHTQAREALVPLGARAHRLGELADFIVDRHH